MAKQTKREFENFDFIGTFKAVANETNGYRTIMSEKTGYQGHSISFGVEDNEQNRVFPELFGGKKANQTTIKVRADIPFEEDNKMNIEIPWNSRLDDSNVDLVAGFAKTVVDLTEDEEVKKEVSTLIGKMASIARKGITATDEDRANYASYKKEIRQIAPTRKEFISPYDAIDYIKGNLNSLEDKQVRVKGDVRYNEYKGNVQVQYSIRSLEIETRDIEPKLSVIVYPVFDENSIDTDMIKTNGRVYVHGWADSYYSATRANGLFPMSYAIDTKSFNLESQEDLANFKLMLSLLKISKQELGYCYRLGWEAKVVSKPIITEDNDDNDYTGLTDLQVNLVKAGILNEKDVTKKQSFGSFEKEILLVKPLITGDYSNGKVAFLESDEAYKKIVRSSEDIVLKDIEDDSKVTPEIKATNEEPVITAESVLGDIFDGEF